MPALGGKALRYLLDALAARIVLQAGLDLVESRVAGDGVIECVLLRAKKNSRVISARSSGSCRCVVRLRQAAA